MEDAWKTGDFFSHAEELEIPVPKAGVSSKKLET